MELTLSQLDALLLTWLWPLLRVAGLVMTAPVFGTRSVPIRVRVVMVLALTLLIVPLIPPPPAVSPLSGQALLITFSQVMIGMAMGLAVRLVFMVFELAGQVVAQTMGLGFATFVDPENGQQVPVISQFYTILAVLTFLGLNGHLLLIQALARSFEILPVGGPGLGREGLWELLVWGGWLFGNAVLIALPVIVSLLIINLSFGIMTRAAPQMNIFAVGFPIMIMLGVVVILLTLPSLQPHFTRLTREAVAMSLRLLTGS
ncbi:MAG: flagellar biosynthetic protein FliR [Gammaproteobacteria bacterium]|nr:MAG: flagellar biosynthetic protein FliR [Gammaproteobacteria bacterium]